MRFLLTSFLVFFIHCVPPPPDPDVVDYGKPCEVSNDCGEFTACVGGTCSWRCNDDTECLHGSVCFGEPGVCLWDCTFVGECPIYDDYATSCSWEVCR